MPESSFRGDETARRMVRERVEQIGAYLYFGTWESACEEWAQEVADAVERLTRYA